MFKPNALGCCAFALWLVACDSEPPTVRIHPIVLGADGIAVFPEIDPSKSDCPAARRSVDIKGTIDPLSQRDSREILKEELFKGNVVVRLGPDVDLDFNDRPDSFFPIALGRCTTLTSVASFDAGGVILANASHSAATDSNATAIVVPADTGGAVSTGPGEARTPHSVGPVLRFGRHSKNSNIFLFIECRPENKVQSDNVRISGFRLYGPFFGNQHTSQYGVKIDRCINIEITNMEIAGFGGAGIQVDDHPGLEHTHERNSRADSPQGRISSPNQILVHHNYIHHNQQPSHGGHAEGYGVNSGIGGWVKIFANVFDFNRHAIAANGNAGGYVAEHNLVLKGGGFHGKFYEHYTHIIDAHGNGCWRSGSLCGFAGIEFSIVSNAVQYRNGTDIHIRGEPSSFIFIDRNIFPLETQDEAINLFTEHNVNVASHNVYNYDTFGHYGVCDFDGDGVDDLFLATGASWWFSSFGEFPWSFLGANTERLEDVRLGYFSGDKTCDVLREHDGQWEISSGGVGAWVSIGAFGVPLSEVQFGRFDPHDRDHRPHVTKQTTHAFRRRADGQWFVTPLSHVDWQPTESSSFPLKKLRFGDFNGDGVTDVLAVEGGRWAISESAANPWHRLNATLNDPVENLFIANMDADDNIDDLLRLDRKTTVIDSRSGVKTNRTEVTWYRSKNGKEPWAVWKTYVFEFPASPETVPVQFGFAGRFGVAPGGGTIIVDPFRIGRFFSAAETAVGASPDWASLFQY